MEPSLKEMCIIARKKRLLSQKLFALLINSNQTEVSFIERGFIPENRNNITKIKQLYNSVVGGK